MLHPTFGRGVVTATGKVENSNAPDRVQVKFDLAGSKWLALKFAGLLLLGVDTGGGMAQNEIGNAIEHPEHGSGGLTCREQHMLTISREAPVKVGRHAWNVFPLEAFGFLLGSKADEEVYAALPCSKTRRWYKFDDRWTGIYDNLDKARFVGRAFNMDVVGLYASTDSDHHDGFPIPACIRSTCMELLMLYQTVCCPQCSWVSYKRDNRWLIRDEDYVVPRGKRIRDSINQKRILKEWRRVHGAVDYSNKSEPAL